MALIHPIFTTSNYIFDPNRYSVVKNKPGNPRKKNRKSILDVIITFDIETTRFPEIEQSIMYIWQMCIDGDIIIGRTWEDFLQFLESISTSTEYKVVVWVHNLSYEFQFLQGIYKFNSDNVFAVQPRKILKATMYGNIEFRCSYLHSNMSLDVFTRKMKVDVVKLTGAFDYAKIRLPDTPLTDDELNYCIADVLSLYQALKKEMEIDGDTLETIPLTSTGYVRRQAKETLRTMPGFHRWIKAILPSPEVYKLLRRAFRGGNTHASRFYTGKILINVKSVDRSSSYPDVLINCKFPSTPFKRINNATLKTVKTAIKNNKACLFIIRAENIRLIDEFFPCPYLTVDKSEIEGQYFADNGRVLYAEKLETVITDIDFKIIDSMYTWDSIEIDSLYISNYDYLPKCFRDLVIYYYKQKTELKGIDGQEIYYDKFKNKINALYGMTAQDPAKQNIIYSLDLEELYTTANANIQDLLTQYNKKAFLPYQVGVWVTAHARRELQELIDCAEMQFIYADTDSVKYIGDIDIEPYNKKIKERSIKNGAYAVDKFGNTHYTGVYEIEHEYEQFITLGAKKYAYIITGKVQVTCAGVNKKLGGIELQENGGLQAFKPGFVFTKAGGTESIYNDHTDTDITVNGKTYHITPNVVIKDSTYTLGITGEYERIIKQATRLLWCIDNFHDIQKFMNGE